MKECLVLSETKEGIEIIVTDSLLHRGIESSAMTHIKLWSTFVVQVMP